MDSNMEFAIETLEIELFKQKEVRRTLIRYEHLTMQGFGKNIEAAENQIVELAEAIDTLKQKPSPAQQTLTQPYQSESPF
jgi:hypothetical protein